VNANERGGGLVIFYCYYFFVDWIGLALDGGRGWRASGERKPKFDLRPSTRKRLLTNSLYEQFFNNSRTSTFFALIYHRFPFFLRTLSAKSARGYMHHIGLGFFLFSLSRNRPIDGNTRMRISFHFTVYNDLYFLTVYIPPLSPSAMYNKKF